ncbi:hypothetical protein H072_8149 [Dactylellina haptotyla CBS 200.50]|uniref:tyrosinase n=1 Tax=Dactylellina haptotyla (strain CBS 200.50) TaxID=1284197 RepID=S8AAI6_DACHA|nr:hypothetical protein H072_8149 [Dactylellina haptotyla CBS 200.50]
MASEKIDYDPGSKLPIYKWVVTGIPVDPGEKAYPRRDLEDLFRSEDEYDKAQIDLYLLALTELQKKDEHDPESHFMLAGIHGLPDTTHIKGTKYKTGSFCTHKKILFPTWHRLYLSLYEKAIWDIMQTIAQKYGEKHAKVYQEAAKRWRLPYWDSAKIRDNHIYNAVNIPSLVTWPFRYVTQPDGKLKNIKNPLYCYNYQGAEEYSNHIEDKERNPKRFERNDKIIKVPRTKEIRIIAGKTNKLDDKGNEIKGKDGKPELIDVWTDFSDNWTTTRQPYVSPYLKGKQGSIDISKHQDWQKRQMEINKSQKSANQNNYHIVELLREDTSFRQNVYEAIVTNDYYPRMACAEAKLLNAKSGTGSLESVHDLVHNYCGGVGEMSSTQIAAHDPIFWLHHCNIDRWAAIWEKLHPGKWWTVEDITSDSKVQERLGLPDSNLLPFYKENREPWVPNDLKDIMTSGGLGYTYAELSPDIDITELTWLIGNEYNALAEDIRRASGGLSILGRRAGNDLDKMAASLPVEDEKASIFFADYCAVASFERYALKGEAFTIHFFLGNYENDDPESWGTSTARLGSLYNFVSPVKGGEGHCENCAVHEADKTRIMGSVSMTQAILQGLQDDSIDTGVATLVARDGIVKFLDNYFSWRVVLKSGTAVENLKESLPSLNVKILRRFGKIHENKDSRAPPVFTPWVSFWNSEEKKQRQSETVKPRN